MSLAWNQNNLNELLNEIFFKEKLKIYVLEWPRMCLVLLLNTERLKKKKQVFR